MNIFPASSFENRRFERSPPPSRHTRRCFPPEGSSSQRGNWVLMSTGNNSLQKDQSAHTTNSVLCLRKSPMEVVVGRVVAVHYLYSHCGSDFNALDSRALGKDPLRAHRNWSISEAFLGRASAEVEGLLSCCPSFLATECAILEILHLETWYLQLQWLHLYLRSGGICFMHFPGRLLHCFGRFSPPFFPMHCSVGCIYFRPGSPSSPQHVRGRSLLAL